HCGICGTDLHSTDNHDTASADGTVLGHEFAGEIVELGPEVDKGQWKEGDRLCSIPFIGCGDCLPCRMGKPWQCATKKIIGFDVTGGYAEYTRVHLNEAVKLPVSVNWREGALVEPLAVGLHAVRLAKEIEGKRILVIGAGPIGLAVSLWCNFLGARNVLVSELDEHRAKMAERFGATGLLNASGDVGAQFAAEAGGPPDVIFECVGIPGMIANCVELAPYGAELIVVGFCAHPDSFVPAIAMAKEVTMKFPIAYDKDDFQFVVDMIASDRVNVEHMITDVVSFQELPEAFEALRNPTTQCKVLIEPDL
ncbi:MAG: alcohol dehydrogenase catalytic domain-containing protein, partial [Alphaproteobacteria bacterium]|nr:alcohol dehydrogenase catalytic domain-containing protein [Alphaproteobacteria bacterium]